ncbi:Dimethylallyltranstransferase [Orbilia brochopaga]|nr:Dimethylallyltranstransferase [Drechslerella brochopaga]
MHNITSRATRVQTLFFILLYLQSHVTNKMFDCYLETGGLFRMIGRLMKAEATANQHLDPVDLMTLMGRYYQIWDDYNDLIDKDGNASDLDEGVYSFMLVHALTTASTSDVLQLKNLLGLRSRQGSLTKEQKNLIIGIINRAKSLETEGSLDM